VSDDGLGVQVVAEVDVEIAAQLFPFGELWYRFLSWQNGIMFQSAQNAVE